MWKPFKPPLLNGRPIQKAEQNENQGPPRKKRRTSDCDEDAAAVHAAALVAASQAKRTQPTPANRKPLLTVNRNIPNPNEDKAAELPESYYTVLWRKFSTKKNVTWDGDGILVVRGGYAYLSDISGREMGKTSCKGALLPESELSMGGKVVQIESVLSKKDYLSGSSFLSKPAPKSKSPGGNTSQNSQSSDHQDEASRVKLSQKKQIRQNKLEEIQSRSAPKSKVTQRTSAATAKFKNPVAATGKVQEPQVPKSDPVPRHDPKAENALVMKRPSSVPRNKRVVDVVVDPILTKHLRPHQRAGVSFLYECVLGMRECQGEGAVLADEMGLGKTLQTIALLWTLLKQNPIYEDPPVVRRALIVCPVTIVNNWRKEIWKWLGKERIGVFVLDDNKFTKLTDFTKGRAYQIMIVGYEKLRTIATELAAADIDIVVCDEGHRLKTEKNLSAKAIKALNTERRIVLSGTPMQNNLAEYFVMADLVNPGCFGKYSVFKRQFEDPINKSRQPNAHSKDVEKGEARSKELASLTDQFVLRRTADILAKYLPPKTEYVLFCNPTEAQAAAYRTAVGSSMIGAVLRSPQASLQLIHLLTKICNSTKLIPAEASDDNEGLTNSDVQGIANSLPSRSAAVKDHGGKLRVLHSLLRHIRQSYPDEKVVIVSNYTSTLDLIQGQLGEYSYLRLDGSTPTSKRSTLVDQFNRTSANNFFVFLLSAKAGGVGLNLIGANRLILFDIAWNPATDIQAMARIHRDGQKKPCYIYRLLMMGAMDEKIFQRQLSKRGLADSVVDSKANASTFTQEELKDLFTFDESGRCMTHELLGCPCGGTGVVEPAEFLDSMSDRDPETDLPDEDDPDSDLLGVASFVSASQYDPEEIDRRIKAGQAGDADHKMKGLMEYQHIQPPLFDTAEQSDDVETERCTGSLESVLYDDALIRCINSNVGRSQIAFLLAKANS